MASQEFTYADVSKHSSKKDLYIVVHDKVYDCTSFVDEHPYVAPLCCCPYFSPVEIGTLVVGKRLTSSTAAAKKSCLTSAARTAQKRLKTLDTRMRRGRYWMGCWLGG
jgi:hypothetical protein